jgi:hypothetical protein
MKLAVLAVWLGALAFGVTTAAAGHVVETAASGSVEADFSYDYGNYRFTHPHLTIKRDGAVLLDEELRPLTRYAGVWPARYFDHRKSITIRNLDGGPEPEIVLDLYWGGAHCCWYTQVYRYDPGTNGYLLKRHFWGDADYRTADLDGDGLPELVSGDSRFAYQFTSFAFSTWPVQIWRYRIGRFDDVTRDFPTLIRRDAHSQWRLANTRRNRWNNAGFLAAWTGDECLLGHAASAFKQLEVLSREHRIGLNAAGTPKSYFRHLRRFLRHTGYLAK